MAGDRRERLAGDIDAGTASVTASLDALTGDLPPRRPTRLSAAVLSTIIDNIVSGALLPDSALPNERELCEAFGVSRSVIRESVKVLEEKGLVRVKQGQGTTVTAPEQWNLLDPLVLEASIRFDETLRTLDDLIDVRVGLESQMTRRAAQVMSDGQLGELHAALHGTRAAAGPERGVRACRHRVPRPDPSRLGKPTGPLDHSDDPSVRESKHALHRNVDSRGSRRLPPGAHQDLRAPRGAGRRRGRSRDARAHPRVVARASSTSPGLALSTGDARRGARARRNHSPARPSKAGYLFVAPYVVLLMVVGVFPAAYAAELALTSFTGHFSGLTNFVDSYDDFRFLPAFENIASFLAIWLTALLVLVVGLSLVLHSMNRRVSAAFRFVFYLPAALAGSASVMLWLFMLQPGDSPWDFVLSLLGYKTLGGLARTGRTSRWSSR